MNMSHSKSTPSHSQINFVNMNIDIDIYEDEVVYKFNGDVDENFKQKDIPRIAKSNIIFELENVVNFNSCGIREWLYLIKDFSNLGQLIFKKCSMTMIDQINMVPDCLGNGIVESFYAPYYCPHHGESLQLIDTNTHIDSLKSKIPPKFYCGICGTELEFDALGESYFLFIEETEYIKSAS